MIEHEAVVYMGSHVELGGLTAAMEGFLPSPAGGWVTSAPRKMTGCWNTRGLEQEDEIRTEMEGFSTEKGATQRKKIENDLNNLVTTVWDTTKDQFTAPNTLLLGNPSTDMARPVPTCPAGAGCC